MPVRRRIQSSVCRPDEERQGDDHREDTRKIVLQASDRPRVDVTFGVIARRETWGTAPSVLGDGGRMMPRELGERIGEALVPINQLTYRSQRIVGSYGARARTNLPAILDLAL